jgi:hypothetical protein
MGRISCSTVEPFQSKPLNKKLIIAPCFNCLIAVNASGFYKIHYGQQMIVTGDSEIVPEMQSNVIQITK